MLETLLDGLTFPEAPRWRDGRLWFSDVYTQRVVAVDPGGRAETRLEVPQRPSGLGWTPDGALLVVSIVCTSTGSGPAVADKRDGAIETVRVDVPGAGLP